MLFIYLNHTVIPYCSLHPGTISSFHTSQFLDPLLHLLLSYDSAIYMSSTFLILAGDDFHPSSPLSTVFFLLARAPLGGWVVHTGKYTQSRGRNEGDDFIAFPALIADSSVSHSTAIALLGLHLVLRTAALLLM